MEVVEYIEAIRSDGEALAEAALVDMSASVTACPGWNVAALVWHIGEVHAFWCQIAKRRLQDRSDAERPDRPDDSDLIEWYRAGLADLVKVLGNADPTTPVYSWSPQKNIAFIQRRMAQETAVHRWDAGAAAGRPRPIDSTLAVDGIDEFLDFFLPDALEGSAAPDKSVHIHCTDAPGEWLVSFVDGDARVERVHSKGDAAVRGTASDLLLLLWRRVPAQEVEVIGDTTAVDKFLARTNLD
ncbi:MAG: maleylpyruvate isomerase family mycothiol-dependent enzyme [Actinomycetota bacterium]